MPVRHPRGRDDGRAVLVRREELEPHRLDPGAAGAAEADMALERVLEPVLEQEAERDVEGDDQRDGGRERRRRAAACAFRVRCQSK